MSAKRSDVRPGAPLASILVSNAPAKLFISLIWCVGSIQLAIQRSVGIVHEREANVLRLYHDASFIVGRFSLSFCPHHHLPSVSCLRLFSLSMRPASLSGKIEAVIRELDDWQKFQGCIYVLIQDASWENLIRYSSPEIIIDRKAELPVMYSFRHS